MVYLPNDEKILAFGGWDGKGVSGQAWVWNGQWEKVDVVGPRQRASFGMAYDIEADKAILFGGKAYRGEEQVALKDFWKWDGSRWIELNSGTRR